MGLTDSHCHLDRFPPEDRDGVIARAVEAGVSGMVTIGTRLSEAQSVRDIAHSPGDAALWCTIGTHPEYAADEPVVDAEHIAALARSPEVVGIGETGLDYVRADCDKARQQASFRRHIAAARLAGLPLVVHARGADEDLAAILAEEHAVGAFAFVLHCFSSGAALAATAIALGGSISFSGILTFPKSVELREIARSIPPDRLLLETDAPYLAPVPKRGRQNEPAFLVHTAAILADILGRSREDVARLTTGNFSRLFHKAV